MIANGPCITIKKIPNTKYNDWCLSLILFGASCLKENEELVVFQTRWHQHSFFLCTLLYYLISYIFYFRPFGWFKKIFDYFDFVAEHQERLQKKMSDEVRTVFLHKIILYPKTKEFIITIDENR